MGTDKSHAENIVKVLNEALPYIKKFQGNTIVIKYGGNAMIDAALKASFARDVILMRLVGINPIIVHGGGPQISALLNRLGIEAQFIDGLRVTDSATMDVVEMVLGGQVNKEIVNLLNLSGGRAIGLTGKDDHFIRARKLKFKERPPENNRPEIIDLGRVGEITHIHTDCLEKITAAGFIPVIAPIGVDPEGVSLNINADFVAAAIAKALRAERLILLTNTAGVLDDNKSLISELAADDIPRLIQQGTIKDGMIPKTECIRETLISGVNSAHILDGRIPHCLLLELFTDSGVGTLIKSKRTEAT